MHSGIRRCGAFRSVGIFFDAAGRDVECPRQHQCKREPDDGEQNHHGHDPVRDVQRFESHFGDLQQQPCNDRVTGGHAQDLATMQFAEKSRKYRAHCEHV